MTTLYDCPECALPATATPRGRWHSTDGPVDHVSVHCLGGHRFFGPADDLLGHRRIGRRPAGPPPS